MPSSSRPGHTAHAADPRPDRSERALRTSRAIALGQADSYVWLATQPQEVRDEREGPGLTPDDCRLRASDARWYAHYCRVRLLRRRAKLLRQRGGLRVVLRSVRARQPVLRPRARGAGRPRGQSARSSAKSGDSGNDGAGGEPPPDGRLAGCPLKVCAGGCDASTCVCSPCSCASCEDRRLRAAGWWADELEGGGR